LREKYHDASPSWVKALADQYPVQAYLQRINKATSVECPLCPRARETWPILPVCPKFRGGRTAAHNQVRKLISSLLAKCLHDRWELHEETSMAYTDNFCNTSMSSNSKLPIKTSSGACEFSLSRMSTWSRPAASTRSVEREPQT
jgi:hypothetical protein